MRSRVQGPEFDGSESYPACPDPRRGKEKMALFRRSDIWRDDPIRIFKTISTRLFTLWVRATYPLASIGRNVEIHYSWNLRRFLAHRVSVGSSVFIDYGVEFGIACPHREEKGEPVIVIEDGCEISRDTQISARNCIHVGRDVLISALVLIMDHVHAYEDITVPIKNQGITTGGRIRIGQGCWIGRNAAIVCSQGELVLGRDSVVAANVVVFAEA